ncbi:hypothetical protein [Parabacteroides sp. FAFU027]|uniref:hypothetical protein n=1 Tax=Parabacteroides sp. FAFU027 TaxID=2922715 RepID=UPI001FAF8AF7|nr:hypothetical protein [Parabacteroides sp. FAFU027]
MKSKKEQGIKLLENVFIDLENPKNTLFNAVQKLNRIGHLLNEEDLLIWTEIELGNDKYTKPLKDLLTSIRLDEKADEIARKLFLDSQAKLKELGIHLGKTISIEELEARSTKAGGGLENIGFIEERYNDLVKSRRNNDSIYYKSNLTTTISIVKTEAYKKAAFYHKKYAFEGLPESVFQILKTQVEDKLLDINPEIAEMLMLAFKSVSSDKQEEWAQALTSCRRFFEKLADSLYPATEEKINGRSLSQNNYINRIWAYMDKCIESDSDRELAKSHVDFIGSYLQKLYKITNKGVHSDLNRFDALKTIMHIYLLCADLLNYLDNKLFMKPIPNIHTATLDELEVVGEISKNLAKEIIKLRVSTREITEDSLKQLPGMGTKTLKKFLSNVSIESL